jgi:hypothetical protein
MVEKLIARFDKTGKAGLSVGTDPAIGKKLDKISEQLDRIKETLEGIDTNTLRW